MPEQIKSKTGNAQIIKQGHTTNSKYGSDPDQKAPSANDNVRDLGIKTK